MSTEIFKVGDLVFDPSYGWGKIKDKNGRGLYQINVIFENGTNQSYTDTGSALFDYAPTLSFTEYDLINGGWCQDRSVMNQPKKGQVVYVRDTEDEFWGTGIFHNVSAGAFMVSQDEQSDPLPWLYCSIENPLLKEKQ